MVSPVNVNPDTTVSNSCNNWVCCTKKKLRKKPQQTAKKVAQLQHKIRDEATA